MEAPERRARQKSWESPQATDGKERHTKREREREREEKNKSGSKSELTVGLFLCDKEAALRRSRGSNIAAGISELEQPDV